MHDNIQTDCVHFLLNIGTKYVTFTAVDRSITETKIIFCAFFTPFLQHFPSRGDNDCSVKTI